MNIPKAVYESPMADDDALEVYWDDLRVAPHRREPEGPPDFSSMVEPNDLVIGTSRQRILVVIKPDGRILFGPEYRPDEAAVVFWEAMGQRRLMMEDRMLLLQHMEAILARVGAQDMVVENLRRAAAEGDAEAGQRAGHEMIRLERLVHQAIELGRGLARRPEIPVPAVPVQVPRVIRENEQSAYQGREGIDPPVQVVMPPSPAGTAPDPFTSG